MLLSQASRRRYVASFLHALAAYRATQDRWTVTKATHSFMIEQFEARAHVELARVGCFPSRRRCLVILWHDSLQLML